jgi:hypothetical protein
MALSYRKRASCYDTEAWNREARSITWSLGIEVEIDSRTMSCGFFLISGEVESWNELSWDLATTTIKLNKLIKSHHDYNSTKCTQSKLSDVDQICSADI